MHVVILFMTRRKFFTFLIKTMREEISGAEINIGLETVIQIPVKLSNTTELLCLVCQ